MFDIVKYPKQSHVYQAKNFNNSTENYLRLRIVYKNKKRKKLSTKFIFQFIVPTFSYIFFFIYQRYKTHEFVYPRKVLVIEFHKEKKKEYVHTYTYRGLFCSIQQSLCIHTKRYTYIYIYGQRYRIILITCVYIVPPNHPFPHSLSNSLIVNEVKRENLTCLKFHRHIDPKFTVHWSIQCVS